MRRLIGVAVGLGLGIAVLGACEPADGRYISLGTFDPATQLTTTRDIVYGQAPALPDPNMPPGGLETLHLDVVMPAPALDPVAERPVVVWIHGGGFRAGSKAAADKWLTQWASRGYVAVGIDYRLDEDNRCQAIQDGQAVPAGEVQQCLDAILAAQHDAQGAIRWVRAHAADLHADPDAVVALGSSAGAVTAVNLAYNADDPGSTNDLPGPSSVGAAAALSGAAYPEIARIGPGDAPVIYAHCTNDQAVDFNVTQAGIDAAHAAGLVADLLLWQPPEDCAPGHVHGVDLMVDHGAQIDLAFSQFFYRHLGLSQG